MAITAAHALCAQSGHWTVLRAQRQFNQQHYVQAERLYLKSGVGSRALYNAGNAAMMQGQWDTAADHYSRAAAATKHPLETSDILYNAGNALMSAGRYADAVKCYEQSLRLSPGRSDAKKNLQIAKRPVPEPFSTPPPPPPPPPPVRQSEQYLDQGRPWDTQAPPLTPDEARLLLEQRVAPAEDDYARRYRRLVPSNRPAKGEKAW